MRRTIFNEDHESFRKTLRAFIEAEVVPVYGEWLRAGQVPREFYYKFAELGCSASRCPRSTAAPASPRSSTRRWSTRRSPAPA